MKPSLMIIVIALVVIGAVWMLRGESPEVVPVTPEQKSIDIRKRAEEAATMIRIQSPLQNSKITAPLAVTGAAIGSWFFEGTFQVQLHDTNGNIIGTSNAVANGDWMTTDFVPFTATIAFPPQPAGSVGKLVFKNANPSGEADKAYEYSQSVYFQ